ncbi:MAG TPA: mannitol dehydrogenase family protein [Thermoleophilaceae bacterium]
MGGELPIRLSQAHLAAIGKRGVPVPTYDRARLAPRIVHIGVGGFHRAHFALYTHELAAQGSDWGIVGLGLLEHDALMASALGGQDHLYTLIEKGNGDPSAAVIGSITGFVHAPDGHDGAVADLIADPTTAILSLTVTEAGYSDSSTTFDRVAAALAARCDRGAGPLTILSFDNMPGNGTAAHRATMAASARRDDSLAAWVEQNCTFPNSMVDRITPATADADRAWLLESSGIEDSWPVVAEPFRQWVVEDEFAAGRPAWEDVGALFTDRVHDWELYKLRFLNAGHSCMAYLAALAGIGYVHEAMAVPAIKGFVEGLLHFEALPTLEPIPGHPREDYIASVIERFGNGGVRDQIARICIDGSAKFPTFLIPTVERELEREGPVERSATALAGWARYLAVVDPEQQSFDASAETARVHAANALEDPTAFLDFDAVFPPPVKNSARFRAVFAESYRRVAEDGPIAAMESREEREPTGGAF